jgi:natural product precursor
MKIETNCNNTKKKLKNKLRLNKETIRELKETDLRMIAGGMTTRNTWALGCGNDSNKTALC